MVQIRFWGNSLLAKTPRPAPEGAKPGVSGQVAGYAGTQTRIQGVLDTPWKILSGGTGAYR